MRRAPIVLCLLTTPALAEPPIRATGNRGVSTAEIAQIAAELSVTASDDGAGKLGEWVLARYYDLGYLRARVTPSRDRDAMVLAITEGEVYTLGSIDVTVPGVSRALVHQRSGDVVCRLCLMADMSRLQAASVGPVTVSTKIDDARHTFAIRFIPAT